MSEHVLPAEEPIRFIAPIIQDNPTGWGPCEMPEQFRDMPYQPFSKGDRLGKISDWTMVQDKKYQNKYASQFGPGSSYAYFHDEDESSFHLVDTTRVQKPPYQRGRGRGQRGRGARGARTPGGMTTLNKQRDRKLGKRWGQRGAPMKIRDASVTVRPTWVTIEDMDFPRLAKLSLPGIKEGEDIVCCGTLEYYDKGYDRVNVKHEKPLQRIDRIFHTVTTTDDPVIRRLSKTMGTVYATDAILATIMCCTRSNYSWDIVMEKIGDKLFLDKRDNTEFDLLTVNETSVEPPADDGNSINSPRNLALEATFINHNFSQQVLKNGANEPKYKFPEANPFVSEEEDGEVASVGYRYRKWNLNNGVVLIARCEHDAVMQGPQNETQFLTIKALNEDNLFEWEVAIFGPPDTLYQGGYFKAHMKFPPDYPYSPPTIRFLTKVWHPNVYENGDLCISILHPPVDDPQSGELPCERWNPTQSVRTVLLSVISLLNEPNTFSPANVDASVMYRRWRDSKGKDKEYENIIRKQAQVARIEAEKEGIVVPLTLEDYCIKTQVKATTQEPQLDMTDFYDDDYDDLDTDSDEEIEGGEGDGDDSGNGES